MSMYASNFIEVDGSSLKHVRRKFRKIKGQIHQAIDQTTLDIIVQMYDAVQRNVSGVPGMPQQITGSYKGSWFILKFDSAHYGLYSSAPQSARLEFGFIGTDSLGRYYSQSPLPHVRPAAIEVYPTMNKQYVDAIDKVVKDAGIKS